MSYDNDERDFLPVCREDMLRRGWEQVDFVYICGDAYVDSFVFWCSYYYEGFGESRI